MASSLGLGILPNWMRFQSWLGSSSGNHFARNIFQAYRPWSYCSIKFHICAVLSQPRDFPFAALHYPQSSIDSSRKALKGKLCERLSPSVTKWDRPADGGGAKMAIRNLPGYGRKKVGEETRRERQSSAARNRLLSDFIVCGNCPFPPQVSLASYSRTRRSGSPRSSTSRASGTRSVAPQSYGRSGWRPCAVRP